MSRRLIVRGGALLLAVACCALLTAKIQQRAGTVSSARADWALRRVHAVVFPSFPVATMGCFTLHTGHAQASIFVRDPSYTNYQTVQCDVAVQRSGASYLVTIRQSWDGGDAPGDDILGWVKRLFYRPPQHLWSYRVLPGGSVITLPEQGERTPQSFYH